MCYSYAQSRNNLIINIITSSILYNYKNKPIYKILGLIFGYIGIMQLFDMIFWSTQNITNESQRRINYITTKIAMFVNHSQPLVFAYIKYYFLGKLGILSLSMLLIYTLVMSIYTYYAYNKVNYTLVQQGYIKTFNNVDTQIRPYLNWEWNHQPYAIFVYIIFLLTVIILSYENLPNPFNKILAVIYLLTYLFSNYYFKGLSIGRWWCKICAFIPMFFIMLAYFKIV
jgi:hypothetical protein